MIHHVYANRSNAGDWLSAQGIQALLAPHEFTEHLCDDPFVEETVDALRSAGSEDLVVVGGGGLLMDYFTSLWEGLAAIVDRIPVVVWGVGYVDLKREDTLPPADLVKEVLSRCRICRVRDELTRSRLPGLSLPEPVPCPSILTVSRDVPLGRSILHSVNYIPVGERAYEEMRACAQAFAERTGRRYQETNNLIEQDSRQGLAAVLRLYAEADLVLSSRLHGCILGLAMGRRVLAVSGDRKVESFMESAGLADWVMDADEVEDLAARLETLERQPGVEAFLDRAMAANRETAREVLAAYSGGGG